MRKDFCVIVILVVAFAVSGCATTQDKFGNRKTRMVEGAGIGAAVGAVAGGIIGHQSGNTAAGAAIGGAAGAAGGAAIGAQIDKQTTNTQTQASAQITMQQIVDWTKQGVSSDEIISKIKAAKPKYSLTADDIDYLNKQGVSQRVIETMQAYK